MNKFDDPDYEVMKMLHLEYFKKLEEENKKLKGDLIDSNLIISGLKDHILSTGILNICHKCYDRHKSADRIICLACDHKSISMIRYCDSCSEKIDLFDLVFECEACVREYPQLGKSSIKILKII